jgi:cytidyltransferase-like protein
MFHAGHVDFLKRARALGDFLLVGVHNDVVVNRHRGKNFPILNMNERTLSVLSCKHVGDVRMSRPTPDARTPPLPALRTARHPTLPAAARRARACVP